MPFCQSSAWLSEHKPPSTPGKRSLPAAVVRYDHLMELGLDKASADGKRGATHCVVRAWKNFCVDVMGTTFARPMDVSAPLWAKLEEETLAMRFVCSLIEVRCISVK